MRDIKRALLDPTPRRIAGYTMGSAIAAMGSVVGNYVGALYLGPTIWGGWLTAKLLLEYSPLLEFGVHSALFKDLPFLRGRDEAQRQQILIDTGFSFTLMAAAGVSLIILVVARAFDWPAEIQSALYFVASMVFFQFFYGYYLNLLRANNRFRIVSLAASVEGLGHLASVGLILLGMGLQGFLVGQTIRLALSTALLGWFSHRGPLTPRLRFYPKVWRSMVQTGIPITAATAGDVLLSTLDRLLILQFLSSTELGYFGLGRMAFTPVALLFSASKWVLFPRFSERFGQTGAPAALSAQLIASNRFLSSLSAAISGVAIIVLPWLTETLLPEYRPGVLSAQVLLIGLTFSGVSGISGVSLVAIGKQKTRLAILFVSVGVNACMTYGLLGAGMDIEGAAVGTGVGFFSLYIGLTWMALKNMEMPTREIGKEVGRTVMLTLLLAGSALLLVQLASAKLLQLPFVLLALGAYVLVIALPAVYYQFRRM